MDLGQFLAEESERLQAYGKDDEVLRLRQEARHHFEHALQICPDLEKAHEGLSYVLAHLGEEQSAEWHRRKAFQNRCIIPLPYYGSGAPVGVLKLGSTLGGNAKLDRFLDPRVFQTSIVLPEFYDSNKPLSPYQLVVNAIGDAEVSPAALAAAHSLLRLTTARVVNSPSAVLATSRSNNALRLRGLPGVVTPLAVTLPREQLSDSHASSTLTHFGFEFPLLLRAAGFHSGLHFQRVGNCEALSAILRDLPGDQMIVMQYLDARAADGKTRKYRAMMIDGHIFPLHLAISSHWKIHYFTAEMADNPAHRAEDAAFLSDMPGVLGPVAMNALRQIQSILGLDYCGIDFGLNARGEILLFEANATMVVNPPEKDERWHCRRSAYQTIRSAVQKMFLEKTSAHHSRRHLAIAM